MAPAARVDCLLHEGGEGVEGSPGARQRGWLRWRWQSGTAEISTRSARAVVWRADGAYAAEAWLPPCSRDTTTLVGALSSAVLHDAGGVLLHAASVLVDSRVVAFLGPSGAGKSTACRHMGGAPIFSLDRIAVMPRNPAALSGPAPAGPAEWFAYPLFSGTALDPNAPRAKPGWAALRVCLRVHQAPHEAHIEACHGSRALAALRESAFSGGTDPSAELDLLERLGRLRAHVPVGRLHFALGSSLAPLVSRWLSMQG
jgi:hypothetical protein